MAFTVSPVSAATTCATAEPGKLFGAVPCSGAPTQHFTYDSASKHLVNGNGQCVATTGRFGVQMTAAACDGKGADKPILVDTNPRETANSEHISYVTGPGVTPLCFTLGQRGAIGGQKCGSSPNQSFAVKPVP